MIIFHAYCNIAPMEKKLRFLNKELIASIALLASVNSGIKADNQKKQKKNQSNKNQTEQVAPEVTVEQAFFDEAKTDHQKKTTLNANVGAMLTIGNDGRDELGSYTQLNFDIPMGKTWAFKPGLEISNTHYSTLGMDKTTNQVLLEAGIQKNFKNGNYINLSAKGGLHHHTINTLGLYENTDVLYRSENNHVDIGSELTIGQNDENKNKAFTFCAVKDLQNGNVHVSGKITEGRRMKNGTKVNVGVGASFTIEKNR